jgi:carbon starvation protein
MSQVPRLILWAAITLLGAGAYAAIAFHRGEPLNSGYILVAALCTYAIGYRFYSKWIEAQALAIEDRRATPCELHEDGRDFVKTNPWIVFGHHFAAISGPGPLVGPVLAAQFGYLPGTLWILLGVVLAGAVQDFVILAASLRRDGKSLAQMVRDEINAIAGSVGTLAILAIMIVLLAVLALVVVNALAESPWGVFTVAATIPIAMFMGGYLRWIRPGKVMEGSVIGVVLLLAAVWGGQFVHASPSLAPIFHLPAQTLAWSVILYGFAASVLPVWLLLAPRDYLSTFMKLGTIFALAVGVFLLLPELKMPPVTQFIDGSGPVIPGKLFPFCFITIACGAISGFHSLICSGITPKIVTRERYVRPVGYGAMCLESLVAILALVAACTLEPGVYLSINMKVPGDSPDAIAAATTAKVSAFGPVFQVSVDQMKQLAATVQEESLFGRTGGAATLAVGMAKLFASAFGEKLLGLWYHFALMFEALFILTTLDAGTRVGRYLLQDALGGFIKPLGDPSNLLANALCSALIVAGWGFFLLNGVADPEGGTKALWPIFGIANQLLASIALCLGTLILLKRQLASPSGRPWIAAVTAVPLLWLLSVTVTAAVQKIGHPDPRIGFWAAAHKSDAALPELQKKLEAAESESAKAAAQKALQATQRAGSNARVDAVVTLGFLALVAVVLAVTILEALLLIARRKPPLLSETEPVWIPEDESRKSGVPVLGMVALGCALAQELSGEAAITRESNTLLSSETTLDPESHCQCPTPARARANAFLLTSEQRFNGIRRCC